MAISDNGASQAPPQHQGRMTLVVALLAMCAALALYDLYLVLVNLP